MTLVERTEIMAIASRRRTRETMMKPTLPEKKDRRKRPMNGKVMRKKIPPIVN